MKNHVLLLVLLHSISLAQILLQPNISLLSASDASLSSDPKLTKAVLYIL